MQNLQYLAFLVHTKNNLNRKRRRFYALFDTPTAQYWDPVTGTRVRKYLEHKAFSHQYAKDMYNKTKLEMKAMTKEMRALRKQLNAHFIWNSGGNIDAILVYDNPKSYTADATRLVGDQIEALALNYITDQILLGEE